MEEQCGVSQGLSDKESICLCRHHRRCGLDPWVRKIPWRRKWQPTPIILAWKIPWTEEPGRLQSVGSQRVGCDLVTEHAHTHTHTHTHTQWKSSGVMQIRGYQIRKEIEMRIIQLKCRNYFHGKVWLLYISSNLKSVIHSPEIRKKSAVSFYV